MKVLKWVLAAVGVVVLLVGGFLLRVQLKGIPSYEPKKVDFKVESTPERVARGRKWAVMLCTECHGNVLSGKLTGADMRIDEEFGKVYSLNITQHPVKGVGAWSDGELAYLLRTGVARDGRYTPPWMAKLPHLSDEDLASIIAFLRSEDPMVQAADVDDFPSQPNFIAKLLSYVAFKPLPYPDHVITAPDPKDQVEYGRYLVWNLDCYTCHSESFKSLNSLEPTKSGGYLGGGNYLTDFDGRKVYAHNITLDEETGIGKWTEEEFVKALRYGLRPDRTPMRAPMAAYTLLTDEEARAIYAYLKTVPKLNHPNPPRLPQPIPQTADAGKKAYFQYGCNYCHSESGVGLCDLTKNKHDFATDEELVTFIKNPSSKYPDTRMPAWADVIPQEDMAALVKYLRTFEPSKL